MPCVRVRVRVPAPQESVHDPHMDHSAHPSVVVAGVVVGGAVVAGAVVISTVVVFSAPVVVSAPVTASKNEIELGSCCSFLTPQRQSSEQNLPGSFQKKITP